MTREARLASSLSPDLIFPASMINAERNAAHEQQHSYRFRKLLRNIPVHTAAEDAAALAITDRLRTQVRGGGEAHGPATDVGEKGLAVDRRPLIQTIEPCHLTVGHALKHMGSRRVAIYGTSVTSTWFKNAWCSTRGSSNPVVAFVDATPYAPLRGRCEDVLVLSPEAFWARGFEALGRPYVLIAPEDVASGLADELRQRGLQPQTDFSVYAHAPDYTIDRIGPYASWDQAMADSVSYEDPENIAEHVDHTREVRAGESDVLLGYDDQRLLAPFAAIDPGAASVLRVADFGGGLGLHHRRLQHLLRTRRFDWTVWETPAMAAAGNEHFRSEGVRFCSDVNDIPRPIDLTLASGTLQYVDDPAAYFRQLSSIESRFILFDRLPLTPWDEDRLVVQRVRRVTPRRSFNTSYPSYFLSASKWMHLFAEDHDVVMQWPDSNDVVTLDGTTIVFTGILLERRSR